MSAGALLPHQLTVSRYLAGRVRTQKGLLAIHGLGSGKTRMGIAFAQNFPKRKLIVLVPKGLEYVWRKEATLLGASFDPVFVTYEEGLDGLLRTLSTPEDMVLIADEAHKLALALSIEKDTGKVMQVLLSLKRLYKCLLMTGTPVYSSETDIRWLINIASGKTLVPLGRREFLTKYYRADARRAAVQGWLQPFFASNIPMYVFLLQTTVIPALVWGSYATGLFELYEKDPERFRIAVPFYGNADLLNVLDEIKDEGTALPNALKTQAASILKWGYHKTRTDVNVSVDNGLAFIQTVVAQMKQHPTVSEYMKKVGSISESVSGTTGMPRDASFFLSFLFPLVLMGILTAAAICFTNYRLKEDRRFNAELFLSDTARYVSIYNPPPGSSDFPSVETHRKYLPYTAKQVDIWIRFTMSQLTPGELLDMELASSLEAAEIFGNVEDFDVYRDKGRLIGNKHFDHGTVPKFDEVYRTIEGSLRKKAIVYSNFYENGSLLIQQYLTRHGMKAAVLVPWMSDKEKNALIDAFETGDTQVMILHPDYTEGLSLKGASQLHILEPIQQKAKRDQVIGRAVRYHSHHHLEPDDRYVHVYEWCCSASGWLNLLEKSKKQIATWFEDQRDLAFWKRVTTFDQSCTPDEVVMSRQDELADISNSMLGAYRSSGSIEKLVPIDTAEDACCVWQPIESCAQKIPCATMDVATQTGIFT